MIAFLTSLRHPETASDYRRVEQMFELCARSVCGQTERDIAFFVVCHEVPKIDIRDPRIHYLVVDWEVPTVRSDQRNFHSHQDIDKGLKIALGAWRAIPLNPEYFFIVDADDWVNCQVANHLMSQPPTSGYVVDKGHFVDWNNAEYKRRRGLSQFCGSTLCPSGQEFLDCLPALREFESEPSFEQLENALPLDFLEVQIGAHRLPAHFKKLGKPLTPIPFFATAWVTNNGENNLGRMDSSGGRRLSESFCRQYNIPLELVNGTHQDCFKNLFWENLAYCRSTMEYWFKSKSRD